MSCLSLLGTSKGELVKNRSIPIFFALSTLIAVSGCAFSAVKRPNPGQYQSRFPLSQTISVLIPEAAEASKSSIEAMGWETLTVNAAIGIVRSKARPVVIPALCDCGTWNGSVVSGTADATLVVNLESGSAEGTTLVRLSVECVTNFAGQNLYGATTRRETYGCASKGGIENEFWATLKRVVAANTKQ